MIPPSESASRYQAEQSLAGDGVQRALRSRFPPRLKRGVRHKRKTRRQLQANGVRPDYGLLGTATATRQFMCPLIPRFVKKLASL